MDPALNILMDNHINNQQFTYHIYIFTHLACAFIQSLWLQLSS